MFETRSHPWDEVGLARQLTRGAVKRARVEAAILLILLAAVLVVYAERRTLFGPGFDTPVSILAAVALVALGWQFARDVGRALSPRLLPADESRDGRDRRLPRAPGVRHRLDDRGAAGRRA